LGMALRAGPVDLALFERFLPRRARAASFRSEPCRRARRDGPEAPRSRDHASRRARAPLPPAAAAGYRRVVDVAARQRDRADRPPAAVPGHVRGGPADSRKRRREGSAGAAFHPRYGRPGDQARREPFPSSRPLPVMGGAAHRLTALHQCCWTHILADPDAVRRRMSSVLARALHHRLPMFGTDHPTSTCSTSPARRLPLTETWCRC